MEKVINPFSYNDGYHKMNMRVFCKIKYKDGNLSITGVEEPRSNGNCLGSSGQIVMGWFPFCFQDVVLSAGWTREMVSKFFEVWDRWHLNDMKAGTPRQEAAIREWRKGRAKGWDYPEACKYLESIGLFEDTEEPNKAGDGFYKYGHEWLKEDVPQEVIDFLESLPVTSVTPAWV
jgi:hypothetical protein